MKKHENSYPYPGKAKLLPHINMLLYDNAIIEVNKLLKGIMRHYYIFHAWSLDLHSTEGWRVGVSRGEKEGVGYEELAHLV